jgi:signal peptidase I
MDMTLVRLARRTVGLVGVVLLVLFIGLSVVTNLSPLAGREVFTIVGGSMEPAIPLGSLVVATRTDPMTIEAGDVVTIRADNGTVVTHRVTQVVDLPEGRAFELKGDANEAADGGLVPARAIVGLADLHVPFAGYARRFLSTTTGLVAALAALGAVGLVYQLLSLIGRPATGAPPLTREPLGP